MVAPAQLQQRLFTLRQWLGLGSFVRWHSDGLWPSFALCANRTALGFSRHIYLTSFRQLLAYRQVSVVGQYERGVMTKRQVPPSLLSYISPCDFNTGNKKPAQRRVELWGKVLSLIMRC